MQLHTIQPNTRGRRGQRIGRGGKRGTTAGRGTKGQKARAGHKIRPQMRDIIKSIPKLRGRGKHSFMSYQSAVHPVSLARLEKAFSNGEIVSIKSLMEKGIIARVQGALPRVKILGNTPISKSLSIVGIPASKSAGNAIRKAGGSLK